MNPSIKNSFRYPLLSNLINKYQLKRTKSFHPTYHHSTGLNGEFDSDLDVLLYSDRHDVCEALKEQICRNLHPLVNSHHDILMSMIPLPFVVTDTKEALSDYKAPLMINNRVKIAKLRQSCDSYCMQMTTFVCIDAIDNFYLHYCYWPFFKHHGTWQCLYILFSFQIFCMSYQMRHLWKALCTFCNQNYCIELLKLTTFE